MRKCVAAVARVLPFFLLSTPFVFSQATQLSTADEIRAGDALFVSFQKSQGFANTPETKAIEAYLQKIGDDWAAARATS